MDFGQDVVVRVPLVNLEDVARIKDVLSVEGDYSRLQTKQSFELTILSSTFLMMLNGLDKSHVGSFFAYSVKSWCVSCDR
jgi:hypothetical protein